MKGKKYFLSLLMSCVVIVLVSFPGPLFAKGPNPPTVGPNEKLIGPMLKGSLIVGWRYVYGNEGLDCGTAEAFLLLEGKLYPGIVDNDVPEVGDDGFLANTAADIPDWPLPCKILEDYDMGICPNSRAVVAEEKDVSNFDIISDVESMGLPGNFTYSHILHCDVKVSFIIPKK